MDIVIGIGNELRGDDGIGPTVVDALPARSGLNTITVHQLVPELAEILRSAGRVLFVDASLEAATLRLDQLQPSNHRGIGHACSPAALLGWTKLAYGQAPESWLLSIPGSSFEFGDGPGPGARGYVQQALGWIEAWLSNCPVPVLVSEEEA